MADKGRKRLRNEDDGGGAVQNHHIRFDEGDADADVASRPRDATAHAKDANSTAPAPSNCESNSSNSKGTSKSKRNNKRKRKHSSTAQHGHDVKGGDCDNSCSKIFNGLIVAISTLESKQNNHTFTSTDQNNGTVTQNTEVVDPYQNYKTLKQLLQNLGATISPQVHKRVHYLISTDSAVHNLTQRVRQALKRNVDIIDVAWVKECREQNKRVSVEDCHLCNDLATCLLKEKEEEKKREKMANNEEGRCKAIYAKLDEEDIPDEDNAGWSTPVQLDCCCVCHENGDPICPWCTSEGGGTDCNLTLVRKRKEVAS